MSERIEASRRLEATPVPVQQLQGDPSPAQSQAPVGWICPICRKAVSPHMLVCPYEATHAGTGLPVGTSTPKPTLICGACGGAGTVTESHIHGDKDNPSYMSHTLKPCPTVARHPS